MPTVVRAEPRAPRRKSGDLIVERELKAMNSGFKKVSKNRGTIIRFLAKAGIVTKKGKLTKEYR